MLLNKSSLHSINTRSEGRKHATKCMQLRARATMPCHCSSIDVEKLVSSYLTYFLFTQIPTKYINSYHVACLCRNTVVLKNKNLYMPNFTIVLSKYLLCFHYAMGPNLIGIIMCSTSVHGSAVSFEPSPLLTQSWCQVKISLPLKQAPKNSTGIGPHP